jgi:hypothetical protein
MAQEIKSVQPRRFFPTCSSVIRTTNCHNKILHQTDHTPVIYSLINPSVCLSSFLLGFPFLLDFILF